MSPLFCVAFYFDRSLVRRTPLDLPLLVFLATAIVGLWAAYDSNAAQSKIWMLIAAYILFYALALQPVSYLPLVAWLFAALGLAIALFFLLTYAWQASSLRPILAIQALPPNITEGLIALSAPFQLAVSRRFAGDGKRLPLIAAAIAFLLTLFALLLTSSRGAFLALVAGLAAWFMWQQLLKHRALLARHRRPLLTALATMLMLALLATVRGWIWPVARVLDRLLGTAGDMSRTQLAAHTLDLITDFPLTGAGLAAFPGLYSRYILGIPYYFLPNGHNILLDITLEQGLAGAFAFLLIVILTFWLLLQRAADAAGASNPFHVTLAGAAIASFSALLIHGMVEDTVYGSAALPLLFAVPGLAIALDHANQRTDTAQIRAWDRRNAAAVGIVALAILGASALPQGRALWSSNLGAISMARVELAGFPTDQWVHIADSGESRAAAEQFQRALHYNPQQRTALHRLGLLSLQRGDFVTASNYLQRASAIDPGHIGVRKALGYSYAWSGDIQQAVQNLQTAPFVAQELEAYVAWWQQQGRRDLAQTAGRLRPYFLTMENEQ